MVSFWMALCRERFEFMFINFHRTMAFMKEMLTFSCYNHLNSHIIINASWKLWWLLSHAEAGTKKDKLGLNILLLIYWLKLLDCTCWIYVYNKCLKFCASQTLLHPTTNKVLFSWTHQLCKIVLQGGRLKVKKCCSSMISIQQLFSR